LRLRLATDSVATYVEFRAARYAVLKILMVLLQIYSFRVQSQHAPDRSREMRADGTAVGLRAESVSILTIVNLAIGDVFDSVLHVTFIWASSCTVRLLLVLLAAARGFYSFSWALTYAFEIWRDRHRELFRRPNSKMRAVVMAEQFNSLICFTVPFGSFLLMLNAEANGITAATLGLQAMWVPQILSDAWSSVAAPLHPHFILASSWARCLQVLYIWGCPRSLFSGGYAGMGGGDGKLLLPGLTSTLPVLNSSVCAIVVSMHVGQLAVMVGQRTWRPRFFVPWLCMPWAYNYRNAANLAASESQDCAICMMELETSKDVKGKGTRRVVAPCGHVFHEPCLERWMQVKMECPTCRGLLPRMI
jgi:hypothetical protein